MDDETELTQLVLHERQGRDRGWWDAMAAAFAPGARVRLSWIDGTADEFVAGSKAMAAGGTLATHRMGTPIVEVVADRALIEAPAAIVLRTELGGAEVDLVSWARLIYRAERGTAGWRFTSLDAVYESDTVTPTLPGVEPQVDHQRLRAARPSYRWLAYALGDQGHSVADDLPGDDRPESVAAIYAAAHAWLGETRAAA